MTAPLAPMLDLTVAYMRRLGANGSSLAEAQTQRHPKGGT